MSHGLNIFYSFFGIYRAVLHYWNKGYRNIIVCVPNWRKNSEYTGYGYEYLHKLSERGLVALTPSICYDDRFMLKEAKDKTGWIVTNDQFKDFGKEWKDTKNRCIPFEFNGNHFIPITISSEVGIGLYSHHTTKHLTCNNNQCLQQGEPVRALTG
ncbi:protein KHNYN-like isoform X1 [Alosa pseudoharengus]|uniref:protein KHNYN-like isoform X1 n=1 Tax=Alosa pseudoharengus TaxID=34774 RepID=UPI003F88C381